MKKCFYITSTLPYVNSAPHLGFALEIIQADFIARYHRLQGDEVIFNTGTDEHGIKIFRAAKAQGKDPQTYVDEYASKFNQLKESLNLSYTNFIRTTNPSHKRAAQEFWERCKASGDIYKKSYKVKYCVGCELEKTDSELENDKCPLHPNLVLETIEEENYFFKWSKYQQPLLDFYEKTPDFVVPSFRFDEIKKFVKNGLNDFSISRLKEKMPWGVAVPGDTEHVMFVWFDALVSYISTLGWPEDKENFSNFWPVVQIAGKDNLRQQSAMWQAMLMSAGLPNSKQIIIHGFITSNGQKMSKSLGNVINPYEVVEKYGTDSLRYWVAAKANPFEDSDFTFEKFQETYNADLANGLGNLVSRVAKLCEGIDFNGKLKSTGRIKNSINTGGFEIYMHKFEFNLALEQIWKEIKRTDVLVNEKKPWEQDLAIKEQILLEIVPRIIEIAESLQPFLPETAKKILDQFSGEIKSQAPLFPRI